MAPAANPYAVSAIQWACIVAGLIAVAIIQPSTAAAICAVVVYPLFWSSLRSAVAAKRAAEPAEVAQ